MALRQNQLKVSNRGYFVYCNGKTDIDKFNGKLDFDLTLIAYEGKDNWIEGIVKEIFQCLNSQDIPKPGKDCDFCAYQDAVKEVLK